MGKEFSIKVGPVVGFWVLAHRLHTACTPVAHRCEFKSSLLPGPLKGFSGRLTLSGVSICLKNWIVGAGVLRRPARAPVPHSMQRCRIVRTGAAVWIKPEWPRLKNLLLRNSREGVEHLGQTLGFVGDAEVGKGPDVL